MGSCVEQEAKKVVFLLYSVVFIQQDGVAIFISKTIKIEDEVQVRFRDQGDRVALIMVLQLPV